MTVKEIPPSESSPEKVGLGAIDGHFVKPQSWIRGRKVVGEIVNKGRRRSEPLEVPEAVDRDSFFYHCPTGCPKPPPMKVRAVAMVSEEGNVIKMAMLRGSTRRTTLEVNGIFSEPPKVKKDAWVQYWLERGWLIRSHGSSRQRRFQPIHKSVPVDDWKKGDSGME